jgi:hypothetical protein
MSREFEKFSEGICYRQKRLTAATVETLPSKMYRWTSVATSLPASLYLRCDADTGSNIIDPISFYRFVRPEIDADFHGRR